MENKIDIGQAFKEKLNHLDKMPNEFGWKAIENELDKNKKKRFLFFPLWTKFAGVLILGVLIGNYFMNKSEDEIQFLNESAVQNQSKSENKNSDKILQKSFNETIKIDTKTNINNDETEDEISNLNPNIFTKNKQIIQSKNEKTAVVNWIKKSNSNSLKNRNRLSNTKRNFSLKTDSYQKNQTKSNDLNAIDLYENNQNEVTESEFKNDSINNKLNSTTAVFNEINSKTPLENAIEIVFGGETNICLDNSAIEKLKFEFKKDSIQNVLLKNNELSKIEADTIKKSQEKEINFEGFAFITPVFPLFLSDKSTIDDRLNNNPKSTKTSFGFGAFLCYQGNEKLSVRIGFKSMNYQFITENVLINTSNYAQIEFNSNYSNSMIYNMSNNESKMNITQNLRYYEIPLEAKYSFFKFRKNTKINAIIGFEYLFLSQNTIDISTSNLKLIDIGQTKDLITQSIGFNIGIGFEYKLTKKMKFNFEPILNYHFSNIQDSSKMNYFSVNLLTGLQYKF